MLASTGARVVASGGSSIRSHSIAAVDTPLVLAAFFWKLLSLEGAHPLLEQCATCGAADGLEAFDMGEGGVLCRSCRRGGPISPEALALLRRILGGGLSGALDEPPGAATEEVEALAQRAIEHHLCRRLRTLGALHHS